jgi:hypothetical protein
VSLFSSTFGSRWVPFGLLFDTFGHPGTIIWGLFESLVHPWATIWGSLAVLGQLCGFFWHPRGPKVEMLKNIAVLDPKKYFFRELFGRFFIKNECVCGCFFAYSFLSSC